MKRLADILLIVAALLLLAACTDDADVYNTSAPSEGNLCVYIPVSRGADDAALGSLSQTVPAYNASVDECQINDLHLYAFPVGGNGTLISQELPSPAAGSMINQQVASYQLKIKPGKYRVYVVANMEDVLDGTTIATENDLKGVVLSYAPMSKSGMPVANNIPMIYEPPTKNADGTATDGTINIKTTDKTATTVMANLRFTCVKVCLNLVYDPNAAGVDAALKANGLQISDIMGKQLSPQTSLLWDGKFTNPNVKDDYAKGIESSLYDATAHTGSGSYYTSWTETPANANVNNEDIISVKGEGTATHVDPKQKWLFRATYYLPERYVAKASQQSYLKIDGKIGSDIDNSYNINLGHRQDETSTTEIPTFPRSTYYEIVGRLKTLGNIDLDCVVGVKDWEMPTIDVDLNHTTLWVSKTKAEVGSQKVDYIDYLTNVTNIEFGCDTEIEKIPAGKSPVIVAANDIATHRIRFSINPELSVADFTAANALTGSAKVWIKAGNIKKYLDVSYDVTPYFKVDPVDIVIQYDAENSPELTKVVKFTTNLGGIQFPEGWKVSGSNGQDVTTAKSTINIKCDNPQMADGTFTIKATTNPETTTTHTFTVKPLVDTSNHFEQQIRVTVRPPVGDYHIYMRAINDLVWYNGSNQEYQHSNMHDEEAYNGTEKNYNWLDGWYEEQNANWEGDRFAHPNYHFVYIYTQKGETQSDGSKDPNTAEWYFGKTDHTELDRNPVSGNNKVSDWWPGRSMTADYNNPGWYYYSIAHGATSVGNNGKGEAQEHKTPVKTIKPGRTLLIFNNATFLSEGFQSHRFTHHNNPGITLFNYEDREGWYLYDPTSDPYYRVYDKKPTVVDVEYTIYTKYEITGWYVNYGVKNSDGSQQFTMKSDNPNVENEFKCYAPNTTGNDGNRWYKTILHLKAPLGEYDKNLHLKLTNGDEPLLFDGDSYSVTGTVTRTVKGPNGNRNCKRYVIEGWYDGTWHMVCPR